MPGTVTIGCKLPRGYTMCVYDMVTAHEPIMTGGSGGLKEVKKAFLSGRVTLNGTRRREDGQNILGSYAFTHGVDADLYARWLEVHKDTDLVKMGFIIGHAKPQEAQAEARAHESVKTGYEPVDPQSMPAEFKNKIKTADEQSKAA